MPLQRSHTVYTFNQLKTRTVQYHRRPAGVAPRISCIDGVSVRLVHPGGLTLAHHNTTACCGSQTLTLPEWTVELTWTSVVLIRVHPVPTGFHVSRTNLPESPAPWFCNNILWFPFFLLKVSSCFLSLHRRAETLMDSKPGSWSPPTLSYCVKTHLLYLSSHITRPQSHPLRCFASMVTMTLTQPIVICAFQIIALN